MGYVRAKAALRDAKRLLDIGFAAASIRHLDKLRANLEKLSLSTVIEYVVAKEAVDRLELFDMDPKANPDGRTADAALAAARKCVVARYRRGRCTLCKGPALDCARRHARGRSCA